MNYKQRLKEIDKEIQDCEKRINSLLEESEKVTDKMLHDSDDHIKCTCIACDGLGYQREDETKRLCPLCQGKQYIWVKKYK